MLFIVSGPNNVIKKHMKIPTTQFLFTHTHTLTHTHTSERAESERERVRERILRKEKDYTLGRVPRSKTKCRKKGTFIRSHEKLRYPSLKFGESQPAYLSYPSSYNPTL